MSSPIAGRLTLVIPLLCASLTFLLFVGLSPSHPQSRLHIQGREVAHPFQQRKITITDQITTTILTTDSVTVSEFAADISSTSSWSRYYQYPTSVSSSPSFSPTFSSSYVPISSSSSRTASQTHQTSRNPTSASSSFLGASSSRSSTRVLVPSPLFTSSTTTFSAAEEPLILTSASPTSVARFLPSPSTSASPVEAIGSGSFWSKKGAVGGVFAAVGLVIAGIAAFFLITYINRAKKNRIRRHDEELFSNYFDREHSRHGSSPGPDSLNYPAIDPFAAGEVVQVPGSAASLHRGIGGGMVSGPSPPSSKTGHGGYSSDDGHSSHGHSSMHHGFSSISYHAGFSETRANFARSESPLLSQPPKSVPPPFSPSGYRSEDPFSNAAAKPPSANAVPSAHTVPSPFLGAGQVNNHLEANPDDSYYADQSYYYGAGARGPPVPRSIGQAF